ncbi:MAG: hypothetical protein QF535_21400 [Anaerolineales bacterium]|nr:hypothetical protein [Anaerolineales bacterium]
MPMDQYRGEPYNPFAPTFLSGSTVDEAKIPQIENPQAIAPITEESTMDKIGDVALEKGGNVAADKGGDMLTNYIGGKGGTAPFTAGAKAAGPMGYLQTAAGNTVGGAATGAAASGGALAGMGAAIAPVLPFVIGAMALKSIFKK